MSDLSMSMNTIRLVDVENVDHKAYKAYLGDGVILSQDGRILMLQRSLSWGRFKADLNLSGRSSELNESVLRVFLRELQEDLQVIVDPEEVQFIGALSEDFTAHSELVYLYFWHDREGMIDDTFKYQTIAYQNIDQALAHPHLMAYARWALIECRERGLL